MLRIPEFPQAVIFDVYRTILDVGPPLLDADSQWAEAWQASGLSGEPPDLAATDARCKNLVNEDHAAARAIGVQFPEIVWSSVILRALPEMATLAAPALSDVIFAYQACLRSVRLAEGAAEVLLNLQESGVALGIASNAQAYTLRELSVALAAGGLEFEIFDPEISVWSFACGFSKPNPHIFRILSARLGHRGIAGSEILMVGDRLDNDIEPARALGWQTWQLLGDGANSENAGDWFDLLRELQGSED